jgi:hypothetical protein
MNYRNGLVLYGILCVFVFLGTIVVASEHNTNSTPEMTVRCGVPRWTCDVSIYPNGYNGILVLGIETSHLLVWETIAVVDGWGLRFWFAVPHCFGKYSEAELFGIPIVPTPTTGARPTPQPENGLSETRPFISLESGERPDSIPLITKELWDRCGFIPHIQKAEAE